MATQIFSFPTRIHFGAGVRRDLPDFLKAHGVKRPLVVTDIGVAGQPFCRELVQSLNASGLKAELYAGVRGNPVRPQVTLGIEAYRKHEADGVVGLGGGAAVDVAKAIVLMANHPGDLFDYEDGKAGALPIDKVIPFWVAVPTTAGTGSEVGRSTVISDETTHVKKIMFSPRLMAQAVFADPELTLGLPASITAATGMDALTHNVEAYLAKDFHPICDGIALEGIRLGAESLSACVHQPTNLKARSSMLLSSMMGAIAFQKGLGLVHSCAHALSTVADLHHGLANGIMIPYALSYNLSAVPDRFKAIGHAAGLSNPTGEGVIRWLQDLKRDIRIPERLSELHIGRDKLGALADVAIADACHPNNPRPCTRATFEKIFSEAMG